VRLIQPVAQTTTRDFLQRLVRVPYRDSHRYSRRLGGVPTVFITYPESLTQNKNGEQFLDE